MPSAHRTAASPRHGPAIAPSLSASRPASPSPGLVEVTPRGPETSSIAERPPRRTDDLEARKDAFEQWGALVWREGRAAYAVRGPRGTEEDDKFRENLCMWCYKMVDHLDLERGVVAVAFSYFDRSVAMGLVDKDEWGLALMTCLFVALKICSRAGSRVATTDKMARLSKGLLAKDDILAMERRICEGFDWFLNPPVAEDYINVIASLLMHEGTTECDPNEAGDDLRKEKVRHHLVGQAKYLCERSVMDSFFSVRRPSSVAYAAVLVALDLMSFPIVSVVWFLSLPLAGDADEAAACETRLHWICGSEGYRPALSFDHCVDRAPERTLTEGAAPQVVTPTKGDAAPAVKRVRREAAGRLGAEVAGEGDIAEAGTLEQGSPLLI